jgi:hypothetical protein
MVFLTQQDVQAESVPCHINRFGGMCEDKGTAWRSVQGTSVPSVQIQKSAHSYRRSNAALRAISAPRAPDFAQQPTHARLSFALSICSTEPSAFPSNLQCRLHPATVTIIMALLLSRSTKAVFAASASRSARSTPVSICLQKLTQSTDLPITRLLRKAGVITFSRGSWHVY